MKKLIRLSGIVAFWLSWPLSYVYLRQAERTRVLVRSGDTVLLIQNWHSSGGWSLPGGGIHKNEEATLAATRELMEETTIALGVDQLRPIDTKKHTEHKLIFTCHYFLAELSEPIVAKPRLPEVLEARWVAIDELGDYRLAPDARHALSAIGALVQ